LHLLQAFALIFLDLLSNIVDTLLDYKLAAFNSPLVFLDHLLVILDLENILIGLKNLVCEFLFGKEHLFCELLGG
tara:strand:- start:910 stop:1134 length:225 start_codon:yes stop_codon:yes gene_type:complete